MFSAVVVGKKHTAITALCDIHHFILFYLLPTVAMPLRRHSYGKKSAERIKFHAFKEQWNMILVRLLINRLFIFLFLFRT